MERVSFACKNCLIIINNVKIFKLQGCHMLERGESVYSWDTVTQTLLYTLDQDMQHRQHLRSSSTLTVVQQKLLSPLLSARSSSALSPPPLLPPLDPLLPQTVALRAIPATIEAPMMPAKGGVVDKPIKPTPQFRAMVPHVRHVIVPVAGGVLLFRLRRQWLDRLLLWFRKRSLKK